MTATSTSSCTESCSQSNPRADWDTAPTPILVVEVLSGSTRRRDRKEKKDLYIDAGIPEYWIVDAERRTITVVQPGMSDRVERERFVWEPRVASSGLDIPLGSVFG